MSFKSKVALWFLYVFELSIAFVGSVGLAISLYGLYYWYMIPQMQVSQPIFFDFSEGDRPIAYVDFSDGHRVLHPSQAYRVSVYLDMPESDVNKNQGVFMVEIILVDAYNQTLAAAKRPGIMKYQSDIVSAISSLFYAIPLIFNLSEQKQMLEFVLMEEFIETRSYPFTSAIVTLSSKAVHVYSATIEFRASLTYLQHVMFHWFYTSAFLCISFLTISIFMAISCVTTLAHILLTVYITSDNPRELIGKIQHHLHHASNGFSKRPNNVDTQPIDRAASELSIPEPLLVHPSIEPIGHGFVMHSPEQEPTISTLRAPRVDLRFLTDSSAGASSSHQASEQVRKHDAAYGSMPQYSPRDLAHDGAFISESSYRMGGEHDTEEEDVLIRDTLADSTLTRRRPIELGSD